LVAAFVSTVIWALPAMAETMTGQPFDMQLNLQPAASPVMDKIHHFHDFLLVIIFAIAIFVLALLLWVILRYNARANPVPKKTTHNVPLEIVWTVVPILILLVIALPSVDLIKFAGKAEKYDLTIKAIGKQWYWTYEYPDNGNFTFDSYMLKDEEAKKAGMPRLLGVDNVLVLPIETNIRIQVTAGDVLHSFTVPALGFKKDAVPGRINETWTRIDKPGMYYGQCSELCGANHGFMPIAVKAVTKAEFDAWVKEAQAKFPKVEGSASIESTGIKTIAAAN
jgi:cytochrome c oxidase subunit 2